MNNMIVRAMNIAYAAHEGQYRRGTGEPYINHPKRVVSLLGENLDNITQEMYAATWLHDVLEDTDVDKEDILKATNQLTLDYVIYLTRFAVHKNKELNQDVYVEKLHASPGCVQSIKLCDMLDNLSDLASADDEGWAIKYLLKGERSLPYLCNADHILHAKVSNRINGLKQLFNLK